MFYGNDVKTKDILRYTLLPGIMPRIREFQSTGFANLALLIAIIYRAVNILPSNHPYLKGENFGKYTIRQVIAEAADHLVISKKNIDQIFIFFAVLLGIIMLIGQFIILALMMISRPALAAIPIYGEYLLTPNPQEDLAFRLMDRVFGIPGLFGSKEIVGTQFHDALHNLFTLYSSGILIIAVMLLLYFIAAIIAETAETGTPFGKRYNHVWAPIRLVVAFGMLIPVGYGLNSAQWITLYAAKWGSSFATNGWLLFNDVLTGTYLGEEESLIAAPNNPEIMHLPSFMMVARTCYHAEKKFHNRDIRLWLVKNPAEGSGIPMEATDYRSALQYFNNRDIEIRFGVLDSTLYTEHKGYVFPFCGELGLETTSIPNSSGTVQYPGAFTMQQAYYELIQQLWNDPTIDRFARNYVDRFTPGSRNGYTPNPNAQLPDGSYKDQIRERMQQFLTQNVDRAVQEEKTAGNFGVDPEYLKHGWAGAGIWYNRVAQMNGVLTTAIYNYPRIQLMPAAMEYTRWQRLSEDSNVSHRARYEPITRDGSPIRYTYPGDEHIASVLNRVNSYWEEDGFRTDEFSTHTDLTGNPFIDAINALLGTSGLFDMCKNTDIHPLARLSTLGKGLIEAAARNLGLAAASGGIGGISYILGAQGIGATGFAAANFFLSVATVGILIGFILFYVVPFMPFMYFFFAVGGWLKGIFEAMPGVALWALAHLRIDGEGLPGQAASGGYFLLLEIFLRPILIIFGMLASIAIFSSMVKILDETFYAAVTNLAGHNPEDVRVCGQGGGSSPEVGSPEYFRGPIDEIFFTVMYTIIVYMMGMASFKLIDLIPNKILRWIGAGIDTYNDQATAPADGLMQQMAIGGGLVVSQVQSAGSSVLTAGQSLGQAANSSESIVGRLLGRAPPASGS